MPNSNTTGGGIAMQKILTVAICVLLASSTVTRSATARDPTIEQLLASRVGTTSNDAAPVFTNGVLTGCGVSFESLIRDFAYRQGSFSRVDGSFNLMAAKNGMGILLKIVVNDLDPQTHTISPAAPVTAFFVSGNATSLPFLVGQLESDTPGAVVAVYSAEKVFPMLFKSVSEGTVTVAFARKKGGVDVQVPIDLSVEDTDDNGKKLHSNKAATNFSKCALELLNVQRKQLER